MEKFLTWARQQESMSPDALLRKCPSGMLLLDLADGFGYYWGDCFSAVLPSVMRATRKYAVTIFERVRDVEVAEALRTLPDVEARFLWIQKAKYKQGMSPHAPWKPVDLSKWAGQWAYDAAYDPWYGTKAGGEKARKAEDAQCAKEVLEAFPGLARRLEAYGKHKNLDFCS